MPFKICLAIPDQHTASSYYRGWLPYRHCKSILADEGILLEAREGLINLGDADACVLYRGVHPDIWPLVTWLGVMKQKPLYFDFDDHLLAIPDWSPASGAVKELNQKVAVVQSIALAKGVAVTTAPLKEAVGTPDKTTVLPNLIDPADYPVPDRCWHRDKVVVYWGGSNSHEEDLRVVVPALRELRKEFGSRVDIAFNWYCPEWIERDPEIRPTVLQGCAVEQYPAMMRVIGPHVGLMPLSTAGDDFKFNVCKSAIKHFEMALSGAVSVASDMPPYAGVIHSGRDGFLCAGVAGWASQLCLVVDNFLARGGAYRALRECAHDSVVEHHSWQAEDQRELWLNWFRKIAAEGK